MSNHAIVVTSWHLRSLEAAVAEATRLGLQVLGPSPVTTNAYQSILICPDGSKEDRPESAEGDARREAFCTWLHAQEYADGSSTLAWIEVAYGNHDLGTCIVDASDL